MMFKKFAGISLALLLMAASLGAQEPGVAKTQSPHGTLNVPCANCHTAQGWKPIRAVPEFDHNQTKYPLRGRHVGVACISCHVKPVFANVGNKCADCHADIHKHQLGSNCEQCHTVRGWNMAIKGMQDHNNRFPLTGAHAAVDCDACHKNAANSKFETMSTICVSCHQRDFAGTTNPKHAGVSAFSGACEGCHSTDNWLNAKFDHSLTGFLLTGGHSSPPVTCDQCHKGNYNLAGATCVSCHQTDYNNAKTPIDHVALGFPTTCQNCHDTVVWTDGKFDHSTTSFPLTGKHATTPCASCHINNNYSITVTDCVSCHLKDFQGAKNPDHVGQGFAQTCQICHNTTAWQPATFDHSKTAFPLTGAHVTTPCASCHVNNNYNITVTTCVSCHQKDFDNATTPVAHTGFPTTCEQCHDTVLWTDGKFDHAATGWPLTGFHITTPCASCHVNNNYNITVTTCVSCHLKDFNGAKNPDHVGGGFAQTCEICHSTSAWQPAAFDHSKTGFPLTGTHITTPCSACHINNNYNITVTTCVSCHQAAFDGATTPVAHTGFPTTCEQCHDTVLWTDGKFDHAATGWPLTGFHITTPCASCHINNNYNITVTSCVSCHLNNFNSAKNPDHIAGNFPQTCDVCHNTAAWQPATFDHSKSGFPLTGAHITTACALCHVNNNYQITVTTCVSCHQSAYDTAKTPLDHVGLALPTTCEQCHDTVLWTDGKFDHATTGWPLTGTHLTTPCASCHINNNYNITVTTCVSCHQTDYNNAKSPVDHAGFPTTCQQCHDTIVWTDAKFDHTTTGWPLTGKHLTTPCASCHINNNYNITVTTCVSCHQTDYNNATSPVSHTGFPTTCEQCHDTVLWTDGKFDHAATGWALTGTHLTTPCASCHLNNNYSITTTTCISCHQTDYNNATSPVSHVGFPTTCEQCHDTVLWTDATFNHSTTGFPLTGTHLTTPCASCHINNNYNITVTTCISCHQTDYNNATTPVPHTGFPTTCQNCHDTVLWTDGKFDHTTTGWPLVGTHLTTPCASCHLNGNYNITVTACVSCHQTDYNNATTPVNHTGFPTTCEQCHDTVLWTDATFNHSTTGFPLTGTHITTPCIQCHVNNNYNLTVTTCISCHQTDYNNATTPVPHTGFPTTCQNCHDTVVWTNGKFDHAATGWPLVGTHLTTPCASCHLNGNYNITVTTCISCHQAAFNGATTPVPHTGFPTTCELCHDTVLWTDATFNHNNTPFPLTGFHTTVACALCHVNNNYTTLPTTCIGCHQTDYNNTTNPGHAAQPTFFPSAQCSTCHTTAAWTPANFNHTQYTQFSITHGNANGVCATCHTNSNNYAIFQCTQCHGGNNSANFNHPNVNGYVYNSVNCYQCHSGGGGG